MEAKDVTCIKPCIGRPPHSQKEIAQHETDMSGMHFLPKTRCLDMIQSVLKRLNVLYG